MNFKELEQRIVDQLDPFEKVLYNTICQNKMSARQIADHFEVGEYTVLRWLDGSACPAKLIQKQVIEYLSSL